MSRPPFRARDLGEVAIRCGDLVAMTAFYRDVIGLEAIAGDYRPGIVFLKVGEGYGGHTCVVALFSEGEAPADGAGWSRHRLTVRPEELAPALAWYRSHGLAPTTAEHGWVGWRSVYVKVPEGNTVELVAATGPGDG